MTAVSGQPPIRTALSPERVLAGVGGVGGRGSEGGWYYARVRAGGQEEMVLRFGEWEEAMRGEEDCEGGTGDRRGGSPSRSTRQFVNWRLTSPTFIV